MSFDLFDLAWSLLILLLITLVVYVSVFMFPNKNLKKEDDTQMFKVDEVRLLREMQ